MPKENPRLSVKQVVAALGMAVAARTLVQTVRTRPPEFYEAFESALTPQERVYWRALVEEVDDAK